MTSDVFAIILVCVLVALGSCWALAIGFWIHARAMSERLADRTIEKELLRQQAMLVDAVVLDKDDQIRRITKDSGEVEAPTISFSASGGEQYETVGLGRDNHMD